MSQNPPKPPADDAAPDPKPSEKPAKFTEDSLREAGFEVPPSKGEVTREALEALGHKVIEPRGEGFVIVPIGRKD